MLQACWLVPMTGHCESDQWMDLTSISDLLRSTPLVVYLGWQRTRCVCVCAPNKYNQHLRCYLLVWWCMPGGMGWFSFLNAVMISYAQLECLQPHVQISGMNFDPDANN
eukprot:1596824-Amphidinium_carterae.1